MHSAVTFIGQEHRFLGFDWNHLCNPGFIGRLAFSEKQDCFGCGHG